MGVSTNSICSQLAPRNLGCFFRNCVPVFGWDNFGTVCRVKRGEIRIAELHFLHIDDLIWWIEQSFIYSPHCLGKVLADREFELWNAKAVRAWFLWHGGPLLFSSDLRLRRKWFKWGPTDALSLIKGGFSLFFGPISVARLFYKTNRVSWWAEPPRSRADYKIAICPIAYPRLSNP